MSEDQLHQARAFRTLHQSGCFVMPNPWDIGSAIFLQHLGFKALATTSAGFAYSRGRQDRVAALVLDDVLEHVRQIVDATTLPVNADFQNGFATDPEAVARNVTRCAQTGIAGLSIEDATGDDATPLYSPELAVERVHAARAALDALDATKTPPLLTARCEAWLVGTPDAERIALQRLTAFADAGADCLFAPGVRDPAQIRTLVEAVAPKPLNVLMSRPADGLDFNRLAQLGVRRISLGSALARVAWSAFMRAARDIAKQGSFNSLSEAADFTELDALFVKLD